jgi:hypothetical protein
MSISLWREKTPVPIRGIAHIVGINEVATCSQVLNIVSFLKNSTENQVTNKLDFCASLIESVLQEEEGLLSLKLHFIMEQIRLLQMRVPQRRYS